MNKLSKKQKNIIIDYVKSDFFNFIEDKQNIFNTTLYIEQFNNENILLKQLEKVNNYENLINDYNRLKNDILFIDNKEDKIKYIINFS